MRNVSPGQVVGLHQEIERIQSLDFDELGLRWRNAFGRRAPAGLPRTLMIRSLIYRMQVDALGDLDPQLVRLLHVYAARGAKEGEDRATETPGRAPSETLTIKPGSILVRDWGGRAQRVMALEVGFAWEGRNYRSLSEVARAITGTRWNGRRFFGVDRKTKGGESAPENAEGVNPGGEAFWRAGGTSDVGIQRQPCKSS